MVTTPTLWKAQSQANTADGGDSQDSAQIVATADGGFWVVWRDSSGVHNTADNGTAIVAQKFNVLGQKAGGEVKISNAFNDGQQRSPDVAVLDDGTLAVAYVDKDNGDADVHVARLRPDGTIATDTIAISDVDQTDNPAITAQPGGGYLVAYALGSQVIGQIKDAQGASVGFPLDVITITGDAQETALATLTSGQFVAVSEFEKPDSDNVYFDIPGLDIGGQISATVDVDESDPDVAALKGGGFVVVWEEEGADSSGKAVMATIRTNTGTVTKNDFKINTTEAGDQEDASVTALADGGFLVVWSDEGANLIRAQRFDASGDKVGGEFTVNDRADVDPIGVTELADGRIAFAFAEFDSSDFDWDIFTTIFDPRDATINGTKGSDIITSRPDKATVNGLGGSDLLFGIQGKDTLNGGTGNDALSAGAGNDVLNGGLGKDIFVGGAGRDVFDFNSIKESVRGNKRDTILDFKRGQDDIDLRGIDAKKGVSGNNKFDFIGKDNFSGEKGELRYKDLGSKVIVQGDVNGDGKADFEIFVKAGSLSAGDFLL